MGGESSGSSLGVGEDGSAMTEKAQRYLKSRWGCKTGLGCKAGFSWLGSSAGVMARDASKLASPKRKQSFAHSRSVMVPQGFSSARACSRFVAEGSLLPGVGRSAWIAVIGGFLWLGSSAGVVVRDASRAGFPKAEAELRALEKRNGTAGLFECESLLSLCGGGKLASWGGALGVDRACRGLFVVGLERWGGGARRQQS